MTRPNPNAEWSRLMVDAARLWTDAATVIALRSWRLMAGGPAAERELERMVSEKTAAGVELAGAVARGRATSPAAATRTTLRVYGKRVRDNRRRLWRGSRVRDEERQIARTLQLIEERRGSPGNLRHGRRRNRQGPRQGQSRARCHCRLLALAG